MYTIKQAAVRSGLPVPTVRAWERRYGIVSPERTAAGYRLYDDDAIARLIAMRYLVDGLGFRPSQAAERLLADGPDLDALLDGSRGSSGRSGPPAKFGAAGEAAATRPRNAVAAFMAAAQALDLAEMDDTLDEAFATERFEAAMDHVVFPALRAIGDGWAEGAVDVATEHAASEVVRRRLARFHDAVSSTERRPDVVVGLPPGSHHDIGTLAFAVAARRAGLSVLYLGANVPVASWARAVTSTNAPIAVLGVVSTIDVEPAGGVVAALRGLPDGPIVRLGGASAGHVDGIVAADVLPERIEDAVTAVARQLAGVGRPA